MELIKKNIHMDRTRTQAVMQLTPEADVNIPDSKPDVNALNLEKGEAVIEEIRPAADSVTVRGQLKFAVLYHTSEEGSSLDVLEGAIPFEEKLNLRGATSADTVEVEGEVEDLMVSMINSRKLNVQSLLTLTARVEELYDEEVPVEIRGEETCEYRRRQLEVAQTAICRNDVYRMKEEVVLPSHYPNIFRILWDNISLGDVEFKVMEEKLAVSGDIHLFLLYEGEGEEHPVRSFETTIPFSGVLECYGCHEGMVPDIRYRLSQKELTVRPDFDGEERSVAAELVLDIGIRMYEETQLEILSDVYGVSNEIQAITHHANLRRLLSRVTGKTRLTDKIQVTAGSVLQLLHSEGRVTLEQQSIAENGILLQGSVLVKVMYVAGEDETPYGCAQAQLPYQYTLEVPGIAAEDMGKVHAEVEQLQVTMTDGEEMDVRAVLCFSTAVFQNIPMELIGQVSVSELDSSRLGSLPGIVIYVVKEGDNLWNIGKKYYVPVDILRELNALEEDELQPGQKLLIVKGGS